MRDPTRFVVTCAARTGSTLLGWCLKAHTQVCMHGEAFAPEGPMALEGLDARLGRPLEDALRHVRNDDPARFLSDVVFEAGDRRAVGLKFKYEELALRQWAKARKALVDDRDVRVVHLRRENLLERHLSQHIATRVTHVYNVTSPDALPQVDPVHLLASDCRADFEWTEQRERDFAALFSRHQILDVTYEQLVKDQNTTLARIQLFLGVDIEPVAPRSLKLRTAPLRAAIANFDELRAEFAGTRYERFFESES
jgi:LPS sulfotransferase NodH